MQKYHNLVRDFSLIRGRPKLGVIKRPKLYVNAKVRQDDALLGHFPRHVYNLKKN
jgi:hypothetical protein